jgi:hypothetical protein
VLIPNLRWLVGENLSVIFGWHEGPLSTYAASGLRVGHAWAWVPIAVLIAVAATGRVTAKSTTPAHRSAFAAYLILVGFRVRSSTRRSGARAGSHADPLHAAHAVHPDRHQRVRIERLAVEPVVWLTTCAIAAWAIAAGTDQTRVLAEYVRHPPPSHIRELANYLEGEGVKWPGRLLDGASTILTDERLMFSSLEKVRITEYQNVLKEHDRESVIVSPNPPCGRAGIAFREYCISVLERARHAR